MDTVELSEHLIQIRERLRKIQHAVCRTAMAVQYHVARARDMVEDPDKVLRFTDLHSNEVPGYLSGLPGTIDQIIEIDRKASSIWETSPGDSGSVQPITATLMPLYQAVGLHLRIYERLVRQPEKPVVEEALTARSLSKRHVSRKKLERRLRLDVEEYLQLENDIQCRIEEIDVRRQAIADAHVEDADEYVRSHGRVDDLLLAAGRRGLRAAVNYYDERRGYGLTHYIGPWIDRELAKVGHDPAE